MKNDFKVKNFKVFDEEGATFHLEPITILTGCNSSGKSSMTKALQLLSLFIGNQNHENYTTSNLSFGYFNDKLKLGNFASLRNNKSASDGTITLSYSFNNFVVDYIFKEKEKKDNGSLSELIISKDEEKVLHIAAEKGKWVVKSYHLTKMKDCLFSSLYDIFHWNSSENYYDFCERVFNHFDSRFEDHQFSTDGRTILREQEHRLNQNPLDPQLAEQWSDSFKNRIIHDGNYCVSPVQPFYNADWVSLKDFVDGFISRSLFYLPVFDLLKGVDKASTKKVLTDWLDKSKLKNEEQNNFKELVRNALLFVLADFENSDYQTFIEYYVAKEDADVWTIDPLKSSNNADIANTEQESCVADLLKIGTLIKKKTFSIVDEAFLQDMARGNSFDENWEPIEPYFDKFNNSFEFIYHTLCWCCDMVEGTTFVIGGQGKCVARMDEETSGKFFGEKKIEHPQTYSQQISLRDYFEDFFIHALMQTLLFPKEIINLQYVNSSRANIERSYDMKQSDSFGKLAQRFKEEENKVNLTIDSSNELFINKWVSAFQIGRRIRITNTAEGGLLKIEIVKDSDYGSLLADEGYGITQLLSVILEIQTAIFNQTHPTIIIEEPEIHLHPKFQSLLAEMFLDAYKKYGIHFIIETHSEYLIRRFQTLVAEHGIKKSEGLARNEISIYYLYSLLDERPEGEPIAIEIGLRKDGSLEHSFGTGFIDESENLVFKLLDISLFNTANNDND